MRERTIPGTQRCLAAVIWIDWYPYHVARFRGMQSVPELTGRIQGIELVGGIGVHAGLKFREELPADLPVRTLMPETSWHQADKRALARQVWQELSRLRPEVVLVPGYYTWPALAAALWARAHGAASVLMTESTVHDHPRHAWKERCKGVALRGLFDWAIAGGSEHVEYLRLLGFPPEQILRGYDVVDNNFFAEGTARHRSAGTDGRCGFLYVGRLAPEKNVAGLMRAWLLYRERGGSWPLILAGDGPEAEPLRAIAAGSPFAQELHFAGLKSSAELLPLYAQAGCFVLPSVREPWGLVVNEAMAAGLPVIASASCGCAPDLIHAGLNGWTFDPRTPRAEATLAALLFGVEHASPAQRAVMGAHSQRLIRGFTPAHFGRAVAHIVHSRHREDHSALLAGETP